MLFPYMLLFCVSETPKDSTASMQGAASLHTNIRISGLSWERGSEMGDSNIKPAGAD